MRRSIHRYVLLPYYLFLHLLLLLPLFLPYKTDPSQPGLPLESRINFKVSIPMGFLLFVIVTLARSLAGSFPLPRGQNSRALAAALEWIVLFTVGFTEEIIRWGIVKILVYLEGGEGGFGGEGLSNPTRNFNDWMELRSIEVKPGIWEGVYLMCWTWSLLECPSAWWHLRPTLAFEMPDDAYAHSNPERTGSRRQQKRRSTDTQTLPSKSSRGGPENDVEQGFLKRLSSSTVIGHPAENTPLLSEQPNIPSHTVERSSSPELRRKPREQDEDAGDEETSTTDNYMSSNNTVSYFTKRPAQDIRIVHNTDPDSMDGEPTPTLQRQRFTRRLSLNNSLQDDERLVKERVKQKRRVSSYQARRSPALEVPGLDSSSDSETVARPWRIAPSRSLSATPLLSSSIPVEQYAPPDIARARSYTATTQQLPLPPNDSQPEPSSPKRPSLETRSASLLTIATADEADLDDELGEASTANPRLYPSFLTYSSSYNHSHFPSSPTPSKSKSVKRSLRRTDSNKAATPSSSSTIRRAKSARKDRIHRHRRQTSSVTTVEAVAPVQYVNGMDVNTVPVMLPIMWRATTAMKHTGQGLWYAWLPSLVFAGQLQWWSVFALLLAAVFRGYLTAEWDLGRITARDLHWPITSVTLLGTFLLYLVILILWGAFW